MKNSLLIALILLRKISFVERARDDFWRYTFVTYLAFGHDEIREVRTGQKFLIQE